MTEQNTASASLDFTTVSTDSVCPAVPIGKIYVVEVGAYSDRYISAIFTTRELAAAFVADRQRRAFERYGRKAERRATGWAVPDSALGGTARSRRWQFSWDDPPTVTVDMGIPHEMIATGYEEIAAETFDEFVRRHTTWNEFGDVEEYDIWDVLPIVPKD